MSIEGGSVKVNGNGEPCKVEWGGIEPKDLAGTISSVNVRTEEGTLVSFDNPVAADGDTAKTVDLAFAQESWMRAETMATSWTRASICQWPSLTMTQK